MYCPVTYSKKKCKNTIWISFTNFTVNKDGNKDEKLMSSNQNTPDHR